MPNLLVVDDEPENLEVLRATLSDPSYRLFEAQDGEQAWAILNESGTRFDCMVLDRMMPRLDGMGLARRIKQAPQFINLPIVMQTAAAEPEQVAEGLALGMFCYLTKPCDPATLRAAIRAALTQNANWQALSDELAQQRQFSKLLKSAQFELKWHHQARSLAAGVGAMAANSGGVSLGLNELLNNAIEHGNLELTYKDKSRLLVMDGWHAEVDKRQQSAEYSARSVRVDLKCQGRQVICLIQDEGKGFNWRSYMNVDPNRAYDLHGRGIALSRQLAFVNMEYLGNGNQVRVEFELAAMEFDLLELAA